VSLISNHVIFILNYFIHVCYFNTEFHVSYLRNWCSLLTVPRGLGHIVAGNLCVFDLTNVGSIPLATVCTSDMYLISCILYGQL